MPQYAIIGSHPPDNCPLTNKSVREFLMKAAPQWPELAKELNVQELSWIHLDPNHMSFQLFEAPSAEAVRDYLYRGGFAHFLELNLHLVTPVEELLNRIDEFPTVFG